MVRCMIKGIKDKEIEKFNDKEYVNHCPLCNLGDGALCHEHELMSKDFNWVKNYINNQETLDKKIVYLLGYSLSDRVSYIINDVEIINGRLQIEEYLKKKNISVDMEQRLREILALEKAYDMIIELMNNGGIE